jgi:putative membrane protein
VKAAQGGMAEVALGNLAQQQGSSAKVKDYGKKLASDHSKANDELMQIASREGITLPSTMDSSQQKTVDRFSKLSGAKFDSEFLKDSVADHKDDIAEFQKEATQGADPALKDFASSHVSTLQDHLDTALDAQKSSK